MKLPFVSRATFDALVQVNEGFRKELNAERTFARNLQVAEETRVAHFQPRSSPNIEIELWRRNTALLDATRKLLEQPHCALMLAVLERSGPNTDVVPLEALPHVSAAVQRRIEGWNECLKTLKNLAVPLTDTTMPEETFEPENLNPQPE